MVLPGDILERLAAVQRSARRDEATARGLSLAQWDALRYLHTCNRFSDTPAAVADYLHITRGTASQSLKVLQRKGLIERTADPGDGRVQHLRPTPRGVELCLSAGTDPVTAAVAGMPQTTARGLVRDLEDVLREVQRAHGHRTFGACGTCRHLQGPPGARRCGITDEALSDDETTRICVEHAPAA